jgi:phosphatidylserine/phosphatidylglycerophosphate/cardiolipin synthase-like enzyme
MGITPIVPPSPSPKPSVNSLKTPTPELSPVVHPIEPSSLNQQWFKLPYRNFNAWDKSVPPLPVPGNQITPYIHIMDYYAALGQSIRKTRPNLADFVYIAGWELDLDTFIDPPGTNSRQTLRELLTTALKQGVEVRVLLTDQPNEPSNRQTAQDIAKMGGGAIVDPFHKLTGAHHQKFVVIRNTEGIVAFCGGCDIANARLGREGVRGTEKPFTGPQASAPWHDVQVRVQGPTAADLWNTYVQRFREIASNRYPGTEIRGIPVYGIEMLREPQLLDSQLRSGDLNVQVVRTYPNYRKKHFGDQLIVAPFQSGYKFATDGEMGIYNLLNHAIAQTLKTIYLEDQYLVNTVSMGSHSPITEALRQTIEKESFQKMIIVVAGTGTIQGELFQAASRRAEFIQQLGAEAANKVAVYVYNGDKNSPYWFHSKTWIFDDRFALISSANCNRRGYSHDSEIGVGVADSTSGTKKINFAHRLRMDLWLKHLNTQLEGANKVQFRKLIDNDVWDFVSASPLWDKAPLLQRVNFMQNPESDISLDEKFAREYPRVAKLYHKFRKRDFEWDLIDPNGS